MEIGKDNYYAVVAKRTGLSVFEKVDESRSHMPLFETAQIAQRYIVERLHDSECASHEVVRATRKLFDLSAMELPDQHRVIAIVKHPPN